MTAEEVARRIPNSDPPQPPQRRGYLLSPLDQMEFYLEERGFTESEDEETTETWARACQQTFFARQPQLKGQIWLDVWQGIPFGGNLLWVVSVRPESETAGGLIIPDKAQQTQEEGWVLSVGWAVCQAEPHSGRMAPYPNPLDLVGRRIFWSRYTGIDLGVNAIWTQPRDPNGRPIGVTPRVLNGRSQYSQLRVGDIFGLSFKQGGSVL